MISHAEAIDALWAQTEPQVFITREEFERRFDGWTIEPVEVGGSLAFVKVHRGPEFHFASFGTHAPITLGMARDWLRPLIEAHGFVVVRTPRWDTRQQRFNLAFGFAVEAEEESWITFRLESATWERRHACRSLP